MQYYSTNHQAPLADLKKAVIKGLAEDRGLYMPERINKLPKAFFDNIQDMSFRDIAYNVASCFFGEDVDLDSLHDLVFDTFARTLPRPYPRIQGRRGTLHGTIAELLPQRPS